MAVSVEQLRNAELHTVDQTDAIRVEERLDALLDDLWDGYNPAVISLNAPRTHIDDPLMAMFRPRVRRIVWCKYSRAGWHVEYDITESNVNGTQLVMSFNRIFRR